ncbi:MAG: hypothetical protein GXY17_09985 [Clostridiaceae bacterium]|nr:hypothetical protein [Clostridiaceae bacterium]
MRIDSSSVSLYGSSTSVERHTKDESLKAWVGTTRPVFEGENNTGILTSPIFAQPENPLQLSQEGIKALEDQMSSASACKACDDDEYLLSLSDEDEMKIYLLQKMVEYFTGKRLKLIIPKKIRLNDSRPQNATPQPAQAPQRQGWGIEYDMRESHYEKQTMSFSAKGSVKTSDGRKINFDLDLNLSREFASTRSLSIRAGDAAIKVDPLVVNFGSASASLTDKKYQFDIDADGTKDQISFTGEGSGFLAFDINNDGIVNNGMELFGPQSGNGFSDLAEYDEDRNGWIDENDDIYSKLRIWTKDEDGKDQLFALGAKGIGAIYLGNVTTSFDLKQSGAETSANKSLGSIARSGVFLRENGLAGTIQHVDLTI